MVRQLSAHPVDVGLRTEGAILADLVRYGYGALVPFGANQRYDVVVDVGGRLVKAQCKTGRFHHGAVRFSPISVRANMTRVQVRHYDGEVDLFLVHCTATGRTYAIPQEEATTRETALRVELPANNQHKRFRWARDYLLAEGEIAHRALPLPEPSRRPYYPPPRRSSSAGRARNL